MPSRGAIANPERFLHLRVELRQRRREAERRIERSVRFAERRIGALQARRRAIDTRVATWGVFEDSPHPRVAPILGTGITACLPGVPVHRHMGNDILASAGTPIGAPFDLVRGPPRTGVPGGPEVRPPGPRGHVRPTSNLLALYGTLGAVRAGPSATWA